MYADHYKRPQLNFALIVIPEYHVRQKAKLNGNLTATSYRSMSQRIPVAASDMLTGRQTSSTYDGQ